jgi:N-acetylmuramoyl-L-alanine amidase
MSIIKKLLNRAGWKANKPKKIYKLAVYPVKEVHIHHSVTGYKDEVKQWKNIQLYHMTKRNWTDIAYNFGVGQSGTIYEGRGWDRQGGAAGYKHDRKSLSICAIGNYETMEPTGALVEGIVQWVQEGIERGSITKDVKILAHRDVAATACCGKYLYATLDYIRKSVKQPKAEPKDDTLVSELNKAKIAIDKAIDKLTKA